MKRREFLKAGTVATAALLLQSKMYALGLTQNTKPHNILLINATGLDAVHNFGSETVANPGNNLFMRNSVCVNQTSLTTLDAPSIAAMLQESEYKKFHVGYRNLTGKNVKEPITVLHEGGCCGEVSDQDVTDGARAFLRNYEEINPFFLSVNYSSFVEAYSDSNHNNNMRLIEKVDMEIELLLIELERSRWKDDTLLIFTSDCEENIQITRGTPIVFATLGHSSNISQNTLAEKHLVSGVDFTYTVRDLAGI